MKSMNIYGYEIYKSINLWKPQRLTMQTFATTLL